MTAIREGVTTPSQTTGLEDDVRERIEAALHHRAAAAECDVAHINVVTTGTKVVLSGQARTREDRALAETRAWGTPGVTDVRNEIEVTECL